MVYTNASMMITALSIITTVFVITLHYRSADVAPPKWVSLLLLGENFLILSNMFDIADIVTVNVPLSTCHPRY